MNFPRQFRFFLTTIACWVRLLRDFAFHPPSRKKASVSRDCFAFYTDYITHVSSKCKIITGITSDYPFHAGIHESAVGILIKETLSFARDQRLSLFINLHDDNHITHKASPIILLRLFAALGVGAISSFQIRLKASDGWNWQITLYIWATTLDGMAISRRLPALIRKLPLSMIHGAGSLSLRSLIDAPPDNKFEEKIDFVYTWVNHSDPEWQKNLAEYQGPGELDADRFWNHNELMFSLRSVFINAPWFHQIIIFSNCNPPTWLRSHPRIHWVFHREVPAARPYLPTFNSHAIESWLPEISNLSENFIYMNDDFFIARPVSKETFFAPNGCTISYMEPYGTAIGTPTPEYPDYLNAAINGRNLIQKTFNKSPTQLHVHVPYAATKSTFLKMNKQFASEIHATRQNRFRATNDISSISFLYHHFSYQEKKSIRGACSSIFIKEENHRHNFIKISRNNPQFFCINDSRGSSSNPVYHKNTTAFLESYFPTPAPWEGNNHSAS
jgi:hypothetical protein